MAANRRHLFGFRRKTDGHLGNTVTVILHEAQLERWEDLIHTTRESSGVPWGAIRSQVSQCAGPTAKRKNRDAL
jgi:hypothetical protein